MYRYTPDITLLTEYKFYDDIYYYEDENWDTKEACGKWLGRAQNYGDYTCYWILTENTDQIIVQSTICHSTETKRKNVALNKKPQQSIEKVDQMGECPVI